MDDFPCIQVIDLSLKLINIVVIICLAKYGLYRWKEETILKNRYDVAKNLLSQFYKANSAIEDLRSPIMTSNEYILAFKDLGQEIPKDPKMFREFGPAAAYRRRWNLFVEEYLKLDVLKIEADVVLGVKTKEIFSLYDEAMREIRSSINILIEYHDATSVGKKSIHTDDLIQKCEDIIFGFNKDGDANKGKVEEGVIIIVEKISRYLTLRR